MGPGGGAGSGDGGGRAAHRATTAQARMDGYVRLDRCRVLEMLMPLTWLEHR